MNGGCILCAGLEYPADGSNLCGEHIAHLAYEAMEVEFQAERAQRHRDLVWAVRLLDSIRHRMQRGVVQDDVSPGACANMVEWIEEGGHFDRLRSIIPGFAQSAAGQAAVAADGG